MATTKLKKIEVTRGTVGYFYTKPDGTQGFSSCDAGFIAEMDKIQADHLVEVGVAKYVNEKELARLKEKAKKTGVPIKANWSVERIKSELEKRGSIS